MTIFDILIWVGAALTAGGLALLIWCILRVMGARRRNLDDEAMRALLQKVMPTNLGALALSAIGLMLVVVGILLG